MSTHRPNRLAPQAAPVLPPFDQSQCGCDGGEDGVTPTTCEYCAERKGRAQRLEGEAAVLAERKQSVAGALFDEAVRLMRVAGGRHE